MLRGLALLAENAHFQVVETNLPKGLDYFRYLANLINWIKRVLGLEGKLNGGGQTLTWPISTPLAYIYTLLILSGSTFIKRYSVPFYLDYFVFVFFKTWRFLITCYRYTFVPTQHDLFTKGLFIFPNSSHPFFNFCLIGFIDWTLEKASFCGSQSRIYSITILFALTIIFEW